MEQILLIAAFTTILIAAPSIIVSASMSSSSNSCDVSEQTMKAISYSQHGPAEEVLTWTNDYPKPVPGNNQVLIQVKASSVNPVDYKLRRNSVPGFVLPKPKIPGADVAGVVVEMGKNVEKKKSFQIGDRVAAMLPLIRSKWGSSAEFVAVDVLLVAKVPEQVDFESAAALPLVSLTIVQSLRKVKEPKGKKILIHAGAGGVGTFAIQYAKKVLGMHHVATTASKEKTAIVKDLGADVVIDYRSQDFTKVIEDYDAVLDTMSFLYESRTLESNVLNKNGHYLNIMSSDSALTSDGKEKSYGVKTMFNFFKHKIANMTPASFVPKYDFCVVSPSGSDLQEVMDLVGQGRVKTVIDSKFPLVDLAKAHKHLEGGHVTGKIVIEHN